MPPQANAVIHAKTLLGLGESPTLEEIKHAYKTLIKQWHPDRHPHDTPHAQAVANDINRAYEVLLEFCKAYRYDLSESSIRERTQTPKEWWSKHFGI